MRWSETDLQRYHARTVSPTGTVSSCEVPLQVSVSKPRKYRNKIVEVDGHRFDSIAEARRYGELMFLASAGEITELQLQPKFPLVVNGELVCTYVADFSYVTRGYIVVEDVKSGPTRTRAYRIKVKLLKALMGITVTEVA